MSEPDVLAAKLHLFGLVSGHTSFGGDVILHEGLLYPCIPFVQ